jgi:RES domain/HEPN/RES N-terminal domain 1
MESEEEISEQWVCAGCIGDTFLKDYFESNGVKGSCGYCNSQGPTISMEQLADLVETAFEHHYERTSDMPDTYEELAIRHFGAEFERRGDPVVDAIAFAIGVDNNKIAEDIQEILSERYDVAPGDYCGEEAEFDSESYYAEKAPEDEVFGREWNRFCNQLQTESRFFSQTSEAVLKSIFSETATHQTHEGDPVIKIAGPGTNMPSVFRGRYFQSVAGMKHALEHAERDLGPPPTRLASAGRMNANGIAVFYGATSPDLVLPEVRPPVGSHVIIGRFNLARNVRLLDIRALASVRVAGSIFEKDYLRRIQQAQFYKRLSHLISKPVMPDDQPFEYLPTAVADYLASDPQLDLDGIIYASAQGSSLGANVVLFHKASRLKVTRTYLKIAAESRWAIDVE